MFLCVFTEFPHFLDIWTVYCRTKTITEEKLSNARELLIKSGAKIEGSDEILYKVNHQNWIIIPCFLTERKLSLKKPKNLSPIALVWLYFYYAFLWYVFTFSRKTFSYKKKDKIIVWNQCSKSQTNHLKHKMSEKSNLLLKTIYLKCLLYFTLKLETIVLVLDIRHYLSWNFRFFLNYRIPRINFLKYYRRDIEKQNLKFNPWIVFSSFSLSFPSNLVI